MVTGVERLMLKPKNCVLNLQGNILDYIRFGTGPKNLVMIPGLGDGLKTARGMALPFALLYRALAKDFTVFVFSRQRNLPAGTTTRDMAETLNDALEKLGLSAVSVVGISQGGMIAQWLAIDHPEMIEKLVLAVTLARPNPTVQDVITQWTRMAEHGDYKDLMLDTAERSYSEKRVRLLKLEYLLLGNIGRPRSFDRFLIQAESCLTHNTYALLDRIACPTLVIGGKEDKIVTPAASEEIAMKIPCSRLIMYDGLGHGLYEEAPDFFRNVLDFCR